jgi:prephenate dehydrogenase
MPDPLERVAVIGTGLIGGSLSLAMKTRGLAARICGYDLHPENSRLALDRGAIDEAAETPAAAVAGADLTIIAIPVGSIPGMLSEIAAHLRPGSIVTDVGSTKAAIVQAADDLLPEGVSFVGGHPMAGSELDGVAAADADLFANACYVLTPARRCSPDAFEFLYNLLRGIGALVVAMAPEQHDRAVGMVSHLPHALSLGLMNLALRKQTETANLFYLAAGGFRDMTRIASSNPAIWLDILTENRVALTALIDDYVAELGCLRGMIEEGDAEQLRGYMHSAREGRRGLTPAGRVEGESYTLSIPVDDRPGVISSITQAISGLEINIYDLELVHPLDSGGGLLRVLVQGKQEAERAAEALRQRGFNATLSKTGGI